ncbi:hypothetical protein C0J52_27362 [Blattella germanica]|nr:hypothetical protein C0J52_27362 [Blattella germanica]
MFTICVDTLLSTFNYCSINVCKCVLCDSSTCRFNFFPKCCQLPWKIVIEIRTYISVVMWWCNGYSRWWFCFVLTSPLPLNFNNILGSKIPLQNSFPLFK